MSKVNDNAKTRKVMFEEVKEIVENSAKDKKYLLDFLENEIEKINRAQETPTKAQIENLSLLRTLRDVLFEQRHAVKISELRQDSRLSGLSTQKISSLVGKLIDSGEVVRTVEKNVAYFELT